ncbi:histidine phosphatase family protein [Cognatiyoonia sp. IB215446]|uniref:histidine phosphatase family protein n=1 Tax=Cognatiyoonia sp. IB215446 TaxID=3097355 RepID=UPI002A15D6E0|nr:histidine phosphatase family protein [Cognatiyoonia sp. IB215446]MDX8348567.1 histidine phosphatase family protein [Cognatiyoonia sp. IB215446]
MARARYLSHPQVVQDPDVPVPEWKLSATGAARIEALAGSGALADTDVIYSSSEVKAVETAAILAATLGCPHHAVPEMGENDRSSTGYLPGPAFEAAADAFFAKPDESYQGWETARAAQARIVDAVDNALRRHAAQNILFVGHGAVGTLLYCALIGLPIDRQHDQPGGGGNFYAFDTISRKPTGPWRPLETLLV